VTTTNNPSSVPALFRYELTGDNTLQHRETIKLPGNLLDVEVVEQPSPGAAPRLVVALDPSEAGNSSLIVLDKAAEAAAGWRQSSVENLPAGADIKIGATELQKILYSTDTLRKTSDFD
jgi:tRNA (guanine-N(7)-)-methyltransferase subunit TRM82